MALLYPHEKASALELSQVGSSSVPSEVPHAEVVYDSVENQHDASATSPEARLFAAGSALHGRFKTSSNPEDLEEAIKTYENAIAVAGENPPRAQYLNLLGTLWYSRFRLTQERDDIDKAIIYARQILSSTAQGEPNHATYLSNLGIYHSARYRRLGNIADSDESLACFKQAIKATMEDDTDLPKRLKNLGDEFKSRYNALGGMDDLEAAIKYLQRALDANPADDEDRADILANLGTALNFRFHATDHISDLDLSISYYEKAIEDTPTHVSAYRTTLHNLGVIYRDRFRKSHELSDLREAMKYHRQAIGTDTENSSQKLRYLYSLGGCLRDLFEETGKLSYLDEAIDYNQQIVKAAPIDHPEYPTYLLTLGCALCDRFEASQKRMDLGKGIQYIHDAIEQLPEEHPDRVRFLTSLAVAYQNAFHATGDTAIMMQSYDAFRQAVECDSGPPLARIRAGMSLMYNLVMYDDNWFEAAAALDSFLPLLTKLGMPTDSRKDMQYTFQELSGLASVSASVLLNAGRDATEALQVLEQCRGIIAGLTIDARSESSVLKEEQPELWSRYTKCRERIASFKWQPTPHSADPWTVNQAATSETMKELLTTLNGIIEEIRVCTGLERFLLPPSKQDIQALAQHGDVVCLNVNYLSSEAFLITSTNVEAIPLPDLQLSSIKKEIKIFAGRGNQARRDASIFDDDEEEDYVSDPSADISAVLASLWDNAVKPILEKLGILDQVRNQQKAPRRIWWIGGGLVSLLPIHAAGYHTTGSTENTISHVVSSYAQSLKSLQYTLNRPAFSRNKESQKLLFVAMSKTPGGHQDLDVNKEAHAIQNLTASFRSTVLLTQPTLDRVVSELESTTIAHFACHGTADPSDPGQSALIVGQGKAERLTVELLDRYLNREAYIAYLSACSTAEIKAEKLVDEGIHLASTFQLAGFQHVVGTLWGADDQAAGEVASKFYEELFGNEQDGEAAVAYALHNAVGYFRAQGKNSAEVLKWAPFIHIGC